MSEETTCNVICLKWGTRYPAAYTNTLYRSVKKHLHRPFRFVCVTDNPEGLDEGIDAQPFPPDPEPDGNHGWPNIFAKLAILQDGFANLKGPTLFLDVDVVIMDDIDCFFDYKPGENCIIHNWIEWHKTIFRKRPSSARDQPLEIPPSSDLKRVNPATSSTPLSAKSRTRSTNLNFRQNKRSSPTP